MNEIRFLIEQNDTGEYALFLVTEREAAVGTAIVREQVTGAYPTQADLLVALVQRLRG